MNLEMFSVVATITQSSLDVQLTVLLGSSHHTSGSSESCANFKSARILTVDTFWRNM